VAISICLESKAGNSRLDRTRILEAIGDHNKATLLSMNPARKLLILLEATGDRHVAALLAMTRF
jgi:hypothetical protein